MLTTIKTSIYYWNTNVKISKQIIDKYIEFMYLIYMCIFPGEIMYVQSYPSNAVDANPELC